LMLHNSLKSKAPGDTRRNLGSTVDAEAFGKYLCIRFYFCGARRHK